MLSKVPTSVPVVSTEILKTPIYHQHLSTVEPFLKHCRLANVFTCSTDMTVIGYFWVITFDNTIKKWQDLKTWANDKLLRQCTVPVYQLTQAFFTLALHQWAVRIVEPCSLLSLLICFFYTSAFLIFSCLSYPLFTSPHLTEYTVLFLGGVLHNSHQTFRLWLRPHRMSLQPNHSPTNISHTP